MKEKILRNKKNVLLGVLVVGVIAMTVAFAALATNLTINGTANVAATKWNIHFDNWTNVTENTVDGHSNTAEYNDNSISQTLQANVTKISNVNVTLKQPGDYVKYIFKIKNDGTIDAKLDNFTVTNTSQNTLVDYEVKCYDNETQDHVPTGNEITTNSVLSANGGLAYCYMQVKYKEQSQPSQTPGSNQVYNQASEVSTNIEATWTWVQADNSSAQSGAGNNTPVNNPYETTFDGVYDTYMDAYGYLDSPEDTFQHHYLRINTTTNDTDVCGIFSGGTVCMKGGHWSESNIHQENGQWVVEGYIKAKMDEMERKGASCEVVSDGERIICSDTTFDEDDMGAECRFDMDGDDAKCAGLHYGNGSSNYTGYGCYVYPDGSYDVD